MSEFRSFSSVVAAAALELKSLGAETPRSGGAVSAAEGAWVHMAGRRVRWRREAETRLPPPATTSEFAERGRVSTSVVKSSERMGRAAAMAAAISVRYSQHLALISAAEVPTPFPFPNAREQNFVVFYSRLATDNRVTRHTRMVAGGLSFTAAASPLSVTLLLVTLSHVHATNPSPPPQPPEPPPPQTPEV